MGLEYVDIFYPTGPTPTRRWKRRWGRWTTCVRSGKALYAGISNYPPIGRRQAARILRELGTPCLIHQPRYSMFDRWIELELLPALREEGDRQRRVLAARRRGC